ncbi:MAG: putative UDP-glucuronate decarboxylase [Ignavibacteria bacterium]|nr:putative UDP-glucuronate decarboxylase [Ignavibacteria bacterium]
MLQNKSFLVTGGAGFIGSTLSKMLCPQNKVVIIDNLSTGNLKNLYPYSEHSNIKVIIDDVRYCHTLEQYIEQSDYVLHFAATLGVELAVLQPVELFMNNILSSERVIQLAAKHDKRLFLSSSSEIYGKQEKACLTESDISCIPQPERTRWIYSLSKISDEYIAYHYKRNGLKVIIGRYFNFIGTNQSAAYGMVVPKFIGQALSDNPLSVYGNGSQSRCFCHVNEGCLAIIKLINNFDKIAVLPGISFNIGCEQSITIDALARLIIELTGSKSLISYIHYNDLPSGFDEIACRTPDLSYIKEHTGWQAVGTLKDSLKNIIDEIRNN